MIKIVDTLLVIHTAKAVLTFALKNTNSNTKDGDTWYEYRGYIRSLHMYVMESWDQGRIYTWKFFFDR